MGFFPVGPRGFNRSSLPLGTPHRFKPMLPASNLGDRVNILLFSAPMYLCLKSKRLMLPQESMVCSSLPFLFLIEQMDRHNLADLTKDDAPHSAVRDKRQIVQNSANGNNNKHIVLERSVRLSPDPKI